MPSSVSMFRSSSTRWSILSLLTIAFFFSIYDGGVHASSKEAKIAFHVTVSEQSLPLLPKFLRAIHHPENIYLIDYETTLNTEELSQNFIQKNVYHRSADPFVSGGVSEVLNILDGMAHFLDYEEFEQLSSPSFDYYIHTTPQEYPVFTPKRIRQLLGSVLNEQPPPNFFFFIPPHHLSLFRQEINVVVHDVSLSFNRTASLEHGLISKQFRHPDVTRRVLPLPRTTKHFVVNYHYVKHVADSMLAKRVLISLSDTRNVYEHFFGAVALHSNTNIGRTVTSTSLRCTASQALENHEFTMEGFHEQPPTVDFIKRSSQTCFFTGPFLHPDDGIRDQIDHEIIAHDSGKVYQRVSENLFSHLA